MAEKQYNLVFEGKIAEGASPDKVKRNLAALLKRAPGEIRHLFTGDPVVIKRNMSPEKAKKYKAAFEKAGGVCRLEAVGEEKPAELAAKKSPPPAPSETDAKPTPAAPEEMVACPKCNYRQKPSRSCIMCGMSFEDKPDAPPTPAPGPSGRPAAAPLRSGQMLLTNLEFVPGRTVVEHFGLVSGNTIRAKNIGRDIMASIKNIFGGELKGYTALLQESREEALDRMKAQARQLGANAVVNVRFSTSSLAQGAAELYAYGTAVRVE
ncbi:MAG: heavy metal-binding domain-containing protein [Desulfococcaceae bacterium]